jgi:mycothiol synthase
VVLAVEVPDALDAATRDAVRELIAAVETRDGAPPLSDHALLQLAGSRSGLSHLLAHEGPQVVGYAQLDDGVAELAARESAGELLAAVEPHATGELLVWSHGKRSPVGPAAEARGYVSSRALWQMRRPATELPEVNLPDGVAIRSFVPGQDEDAWLAVNAAAFADHAEQGRWTRADIDAREAESWFDPAGFLLAERDSALLGFHWTKMHPGRIGEVYVLGVAPEAQGMRLGPALLAAGLRYVVGRGAGELMLYVEESNAGAMRLYERFGFRRYDVSVQYRRPDQVSATTSS